MLVIAVVFLVADTMTTEHIYAEPGSLFFCRRIADSLERLDCYDSIIDTNASPLVKHPATKPVPETEALFGKSQAESKRIIEESLDVKTPDKIMARINAIKKSTTRQMTMTLSNGQVWRQIDHSPLPLRTGDEIIIRAARLGSYLLQKQSGSGSIRVKRMN